jgi:hypothetical protein
VTSVDKKIVELRDLKRASIYDSLKKGINDYGMHEALRDVIAYHQSCSFMTGLQRALDEGTQGTNAQKTIRLRASVASVSNQMSTITEDQLKTTAGKDQFAQLNARLTSLTEALKAAENQ